MSRGNFNIPYPVNEPVLSYAPGSAEREEALRVYREMFSQAPIDVPMYIGKDAVRTDDKRTMSLLTITSISSGTSITAMQAM